MIGFFPRMPFFLQAFSAGRVCYTGFANFFEGVKNFNYFSSTVN